MQESQEKKVDIGEFRELEEQVQRQECKEVVLCSCDLVVGIVEVHVFAVVIHHEIPLVGSRHGSVDLVIE